MKDAHPIIRDELENLPDLFLLKEIPDKPTNIYIRGNLPDEKMTFLTVVGSRNHSSYGEEVCKKIISGLSGYQISIVSGLALGIDSIAHNEAMKANLHTLSIPGSGISNEAIYPEINKKLASKILKNGGALLSEYEPKQKAAPYMFPKRNRLMAGISKATLIIEAKEKSGTLITAKLALEYDRDVLCIPGSIFSKNAEGGNKLISEGAICITRAEDVLEALDIKINENKKENLHLSYEEKEILNAINEPKGIDEISLQLNKPVNKINVLISKMEIEGIIKKIGGKFVAN